jgi:glucosamine--fructose-6-phosphate aminotransferase (isomerizing)
MCGIVGILGKEAVAEQLLGALKRLEYRGYDSAGIATLENGRLTRRRAEGKLRNLESRLMRDPLFGRAGIGHTRWATHGRPNEINAHPHVTDRVAVVHNGIIENFRELRHELAASGTQTETETDTEVVAHLVSAEIERGQSPAEAVAAALPKLRGAFALAFLFEGQDDLLIGARKGSPLAVGFGSREMYLGSDAIALAPFTDTISYLEDGDWVVVRRDGIEIRDGSGEVVIRPTVKSMASAFLIEKGHYRHFMAKEIHEQPEVVGHTLAHYLDMSTERIGLPELPFDFRDIERLSIWPRSPAWPLGPAARAACFPRVTSKGSRRL